MASRKTGGESSSSHVAFGSMLLKKSGMPCRDFFERSAAKPSSPINMSPRPLSKSPVNFSLGDEVPHIVIRESHQRPREIFIIGGKRLFQHHRSTAAKLRVSRTAPEPSEHTQLDCGPDPTSPALRACSASFLKIFFPAMRPDSQAPVI